MTSSESKYTVLVVDDLPDNIQTICAILYQTDVKISIAQSGREALEVVAHKPPDLILLDVMMPEMDGFEVCERLKHNPAARDIPIIFLTAKTQSEDLVKGFEAGAVDYVKKPFKPEELLLRVSTHLELKKSRDIISAQNQQLAEQNTRLGRQNRELQESNAIKDKFFSIIAHDLRNPFCTLMIFTEMLQSNLKNHTLDKIEEYIQKIDQAAERGHALLENLLEWSRSQTGHIPFRPQHLTLKNIVAGSLETVIPHAHSKQIAVVYSDIPENMVIFADVEMLTTIIRNLTSNAVKYTERGGEVNIRAKDAGAWIELTVADTGVGIKEKHLKNLFRIDAHRSTPGTVREKGTGLGLILCKEFVEKHGGEIRVESEVGKGSHFTFILPKTVV